MASAASPHPMCAACQKRPCGMSRKHLGKLALKCDLCLQKHRVENKRSKERKKNKLKLLEMQVEWLKKELIKERKKNQKWLYCRSRQTTSRASRSGLKRASSVSSGSASSRSTSARA